MKNPFGRMHTALVPIGPNNIGKAAVSLAKKLAEDVVLVGIVPIQPGEPVSGGAQIARQVRKALLELSAGARVRYKASVIVAENPWLDLKEVISQEKPDLFVAEWEKGNLTCGVPTTTIFADAPTNVVVIRGSAHSSFDRTLVAVRGGPHAELALQVGLNLKPEKLDVLHLSISGNTNDAPFKGFNHILHQIPEITPRAIVTEDVSRTLSEEAENYDLVILGSSATDAVNAPSIGTVAENLLLHSSASILVVKARRQLSHAEFDERASSQVISILVDKWFAENTFHADEFAELQQLTELKQSQGLTVSLAMPALNEEETVGKVITTIKSALMDDIPLLDEIVLIDSNSTDRTREIAQDLGVKVYIHQDILPQLGARHGKGEALWKSLLVTHGEIVAWIDTDIVNIHPRFVYGIVGPLLQNMNIKFVKAFYRRPLRVGNRMQEGSGGRVTELTARPLLNLFYPELSGVIQPLSGEYAGRREALEQATFYSGYGVETGLLIDIFERYGLGAIAQVDLMERIHHNQELEALSKMSFAIIQTVLHKLEKRYERSIIEDVNKTMKLIRYVNGEYFLDVEEIAELERPPMITIPEYMEKRH